MAHSGALLHCNRTSEDFFAQYLGGRSQKDVPADVVAKLKEITVDPKTVSGAVNLKGALAPGAAK